MGASREQCRPRHSISLLSQSGSSTFLTYATKNRKGSQNYRSTKSSRAIASCCLCNLCSPTSGEMSGSIQPRCANTGLPRTAGPGTLSCGCHGRAGTDDPARAALAPAGHPQGLARLWRQAEGRLLRRHAGCAPVLGDSGCTCYLARPWTNAGPQRSLTAPNRCVPLAPKRRRRAATARPASGAAPCRRSAPGLGPDRRTRPALQRRCRATTAWPASSAGRCWRRSARGWPRCSPTWSCRTWCRWRARPRPLPACRASASATSPGTSCTASARARGGSHAPVLSLLNAGRHHTLRGVRTYGPVQQQHVGLHADLSRPADHTQKPFLCTLAQRTDRLRPCKVCAHARAGT